MASSRVVLSFSFDYSEPPKGSNETVAFDAYNTNKHGWNEPPALTQYSGTPSRTAPVRPTPSAGMYVTHFC